MTNNFIQAINKLKSISWLSKWVSLVFFHFEEEQIKFQFNTTIEMHPDWISYFLRYFDLCGFCTTKSKFVYLFSVLHVVLVSLLTAVSIQFLRRPQENGLALVNDGVKLGAALLVYWLSIIESCLKRATNMRFWQRFNLIDERYYSHCGLYIRNFLSSMIVCSLIATFFYLEYLVRVILPTIVDKYFILYLYYWLSYTISGLVYLNRLHYYLFHVKLLAHELETIDREVVEVVRVYRKQIICINQKKNSALTNFHRTRFKWIREYYQMISEMTWLMNQMFAFSNFPTILLPFQIILADANRVYWTFYASYELSMIGLISISFWNKKGGYWIATPTTAIQRLRFVLCFLKFTNLHDSSW